MLVRFKRAPVRKRYHTPMFFHYPAVVARALAVSVPVLSQDTIARKPVPRPEPRYQVETTENVMIPMRDGIRLSANIYRPAGLNGRLPVVLIRSPYNKSNFRGSIGPAEFF